MHKLRMMASSSRTRVVELDATRHQGRKRKWIWNFIWIVRRPPLMKHPRSRASPQASLVAADTKSASKTWRRRDVVWLDAGPNARERWLQAWDATRMQAILSSSWDVDHINDISSNTQSWHGNVCCYMWAQGNKLWRVGLQKRLQRDRLCSVTRDAETWKDTKRCVCREAPNSSVSMPNWDTESYQTYGSPQKPCWRSHQGCHRREVWWHLASRKLSNGDITVRDAVYGSQESEKPRKMLPYTPFTLSPNSRVCTVKTGKRNDLGSVSVDPLLGARTMWWFLVCASRFAKSCYLAPSSAAMHVWSEVFPLQTRRLEPFFGHFSSSFVSPRQYLSCFTYMRWLWTLVHIKLDNTDAVPQGSSDWARRVGYQLAWICLCQGRALAILTKNDVRCTPNGKSC